MSSRGPARSSRRPPWASCSPRAAAGGGHQRGRRHRRQSVGRIRGECGRHRASAEEPARLHGRVQGPDGAGLLGRVRVGGGRRHRRELGSHRPRQDLHHRQEASRSMPGARASTGSSAGTFRPGWPSSIRTSPTGTTSTSTRTCSRRPSPVTRASCSMATRRSSPVTKGSSPGLELDYKVVYAGSEAALIEAFRKAEQNKTPLIGYFYSPQWFLNEVALVHVNLPPWTDGLRRRSGQDHLRLRALQRPEQDHQQEPRGQGAQGRPVHQELHVDRRGSERRGELHHQREHVPRGRRQEVGGRERGEVEAVDPRLLTMS